MNEHSFEPLKIAVELLISSSKIVQAWITRFIAVNTALFTAIAVMLTWNVPANFADLPKVGLFAVCVLGVLASLLMGGVTLHQMEWSRRIQGRVLALQETLGVVVHPEPFWTLGKGAFITTFVNAMMIAVSVAWVVLGVFVLMK